MTGELTSQTEKERGDGECVLVLVATCEGESGAVKEVKIPVLSRRFAQFCVCLDHMAHTETSRMTAKDNIKTRARAIGSPVETECCHRCCWGDDQT